MSSNSKWLQRCKAICRPLRTRQMTAATREARRAAPGGEAAWEVAWECLEALAWVCRAAEWECRAAGLEGLAPRDLCKEMLQLTSFIPKALSTSWMAVNQPCSLATRSRPARLRKQSGRKTARC